MTIRRRQNHGREPPSRYRRQVHCCAALTVVQPYRRWRLCNACGHSEAVALVPFVIRRGSDASSSLLRQACAVQALWPARGHAATSLVE
jgi:hypothetical protein